ncbi:MAG TPA: hypothetical protein VGN01_07620, partial [Acidobacteriaceae bacterium]
MSSTDFGDGGLEVVGVIDGGAASAGGDFFDAEVVQPQPHDAVRVKGINGDLCAGEEIVEIH